MHLFEMRKSRIRRYIGCVLSGSGRPLNRVTVRALLKGHEFDLQTLVDMFPSGDPSVVSDSKVGITSKPGSWTLTWTMPGTSSRPPSGC